MVILIILAVSVLPVFAGNDANPERKDYERIRKVDLGISSLTLGVGETYTFNITFEPEDPVITGLTWFNTDETVVRLNRKTNTVTALKPGTVRLMAESFDYVSSAFCEITVTGRQGKDGFGVIDGVSLVSLSDADRAKVRSSRIRRHLELLETSAFSESALQKIQDRVMEVTAKVNPGTEKAESERALALGMNEAHPMEKLNAVSLRGTFGQMLDFIGDNEDLLRIIELPNIYIFDTSVKSNESLSLPQSVDGSLML